MSRQHKRQRLSPPEFAGMFLMVHTRFASLSLTAGCPPAYAVPPFTPADIEPGTSSQPRTFKISAFLCQPGPSVKLVNAIQAVGGASATRAVDPFLGRAYSQRLIVSAYSSGPAPA